MLRETQPTKLLTVLSVLLFCAFVTCTHPTTPSNTDSPNDNSTSSVENYNCPKDCNCVLAHNTHKPFLHAKCSSINGLKSDAPLEATLPIHSIDLSHLYLSRLSHSLEKLPDLTSIDLSHNELHEIGHLGRRIKKLNLKDNRLTSSKLSKLPQHVQVLNLQHNDITYLPLEFTKLIHLQSLELSHNTINCTCETLEVRNWLQERHVFMESPVKCTYPIEVKDKSWLQLKQADICEKEKRGWYDDEKENEVMLSDQPVVVSDDTDNKDELEDEYMKLDSKSLIKEPSKRHLDDVEGSGDTSVHNMEIHLPPVTVEPPLVLASSQNASSTIAPEEEEDEDNDGSGSGYGAPIMPLFETSHIVTDDFDNLDSKEAHNKDDDFDNRPLEQPNPETVPPSDIFNNGMGIFEGGEKETPKTDAPVEEEIIVPVVHHPAAEAPSSDVITDAPEDSLDSDAAQIMHAKAVDQEDSNATYFLLGVILLIVVGLILFVGMKRCKQNRNASHDPENPRQTELLDMDKKNLGKPIQRNGNEHAPLIGEKMKSDLAKPTNGANNKKPYDANDVKDGPNQQQPLLNGSGNTNGTAPNEDIPKINAPTNEQAPHEYYPITPRYPPPKSPRASKYAQGEYNNNNNNDDAYLPSSPKLGRYSPVYSPETGRVKIKLTETPKPKTPMLVTRSKSNAGEIITIPVHGVNLEVAPVGGVNGRVDN